MGKRTKPENIGKLQEDNRKLRTEVENLKKEIRKLKSNNRTLNTAWKKTETYLQEVTDGRSVEEIVNNVGKGKKLPKLESTCSKCKSNKISLLKYTNFRIVVCGESKCRHREKIDGTETEQE